MTRAVTKAVYAKHVCMRATNEALKTRGLFTERKWGSLVELGGIRRHW